MREKAVEEEEIQMADMRRARQGVPGAAQLLTVASGDCAPGLCARSREGRRDLSHCV